jgi:hypothetical protein
MENEPAAVAEINALIAQRIDKICSKPIQRVNTLLSAEVKFNRQIPRTMYSCSQPSVLCSKLDARRSTLDAMFLRNKKQEKVK